jgi:hypothetical protein
MIRLKIAQLVPDKELPFQSSAEDCIFAAGKIINIKGTA